MENEKDRSGEKLNFDERAHEDKYFAAKEDELIWQTTGKEREAYHARAQVYR